MKAFHAQTAKRFRLPFIPHNFPHPPPPLSLLTPKYHKYYLFDILTWISCITFFCRPPLCLVCGLAGEKCWFQIPRRKGARGWIFCGIMSRAIQSCHNVRSSVANVKFFDPFLNFTPVNMVWDWELGRESVLWQVELTCKNFKRFSGWFWKIFKRY